MRRSRQRAADERGMVLVLFSVALTVVLIVTALVFDLSQRRVDRRVNKSVADMAVRAGLGLLHLGPWSGVCRAREYIKTNSRISSFDAGSEKWFQLGLPLSTLTSSPCLNTAGFPFLQLCLPGELGIPRTDTWGKLTATAGGGRYSIEIQSGYTMPDPRFPEDVVSAPDTGDLLKGSCDNLVVTIKEKRLPIFGGIVDSSEKTTMIRSVGRISNADTGDYNPALLLLERHGCSVLTSSGAGTRVLAQPVPRPPSYVVITGSLSVSSTFAITDPRKVYIGGRSGGNGIGLDVGNGGNLNIGNPLPGVDCLLLSPMLKYSRVVVGDGSFKLGSGGSAHLCGTFVLMASGYRKIPSYNGSEPCATPCSIYKGSVDIGSGSTIDWSAPNLVTIRRPTLFDLESTSPLEDIALWTEAGGAGSRVSGGGVSRMTGVYFLGNAHAFTLAGGGGANVYLSAQFISRTMVVTGGSTVNLTLNPLNSVPLVVYELILVR